MASNFTKNVISAIDIKDVKYNIRAIPFHATEAEWNNMNYIPKQAEFIVYDVDSNNTSPRFKTGDGVTDVKNLPFTLTTISEVQAYVNSQIGSAGHLKRIILEDGAELPDVSQADVDAIYMKRNNESRLISDVFDEYMVINGAWEIIGNTRVDLSNYTTQEMVDEKIEDAISNIDFPIVNSDWNASEGEAGHVLNRTHYIYQAEHELAPEATITFDSANEYTYPFGLQEGHTYKVIFDGKEYISTAKLDENSWVVIGDYLEETKDHPYGGLCLPGGAATFSHADGVDNVNGSAVGKTVTLGVYELVEEIKTIEPKFLPEGIGYTEMSVLFPEAQIETIDPDTEGAPMLVPNFIPVAGNTYQVKWNGTVYTCTANIVEQDGMSGVVIGNMAALGGVNSGEPFVMAYSETETEGATMAMSLDGSTSATVEIKGEVIHTIDPKFLPEGIGYTEGSVIFPEATVTGADIGLPYPAIELPDLVIEEGKTYNIKWNGTVYTRTAIVEDMDDNQHIVYVGNRKGFYGVEDSGEPFCVVSGGVLIFTDDSTSATVEIDTKTVHKIDPRYLPEGIGYAEGGVIFPEAQLPVENEAEGYMVVPGFIPEVGQTYEVKWDGTVYTCTAATVESYVALGNLTGDNNGVPFVIFYSPDFGNVGSMAQDRNLGINHTAEIKSEIVHKIEPKYLPEGIGYIETSEGIWLEETTYEFNASGSYQMATPDGKIIDGTTYKTIWNGVEYSHVAQTIEQEGVTYIAFGNLVFGGFEDTGEPFYVAYAPDFGICGVGIINQPDDGSTVTATFSIVEIVDVVHKIEPKYLPEGVGYKEIKYETSDPYFNGDKENYLTLPIGELMGYTEEILLAKINDYILTESECVGSVLTVRTPTEGDISFTVTENMISDMTSQFGIDSFAIINTDISGIPLVAVVRNGASVQGIEVPAGTYYIYMNTEGAASYTHHFSALDNKQIEIEIIHKIDSKYLPDDIGGVTSWNDLEDRPEGVGYSEVKGIPFTTFSVENGQFQIPDFTLVEGTIYTVTWNGVNYICKTVAYGGINGIFIGNISMILGEGDTGEPFVFSYNLNEPLLINGIVLDGSETVSVKISYESVYKIDEKYLPSHMKLKAGTVRMPASDRTWGPVAYGNGKFVAIGGGSDSNSHKLVAYSEDGLVWKPAVLSASMTESVYDIAYGNNKFVVISQTKVFCSEDGITWSEYIPENIGNTIGYGNGKFVSMGHYDKFFYSENGTDWIAGTLPGDMTYCSNIVYANGKFVVFGGNGYEDNQSWLCYSEDGVNWNAIADSSYLRYDSVAYGNGKFVAIANESDIAIYSTDGINWSETKLPYNNYRSVVYGNGKFVAIRGEYQEKPIYSEDGVTWYASEEIIPIDYCELITYKNGKFFIFEYNSDLVYYSEDGINWKTEYKFIFQDGVDIINEIIPSTEGFATQEYVDAQIAEKGLPAITEADEGAFLRVVNGKWAIELLSNAEEVEF